MRAITRLSQPCKELQNRGSRVRIPPLLPLVPPLHHAADAAFTDLDTLGLLFVWDTVWNTVFLLFGRKWCIILPLYQGRVCEITQPCDAGLTAK